MQRFAVLLAILCIGAFGADVKDSLDISGLLNIAQDSASSHPAVLPSIPTVVLEEPTKILPATMPVSKPLAVYLGEGNGGPWYGLGVLEAIERYKIPVTRVVGAGWGAWLASVWAEGYSTQQIHRWLDQVDSLDPDFFWPGLHDAGQSNTRPALADAVMPGSIPMLGAEWTIQNSVEGIPQIQVLGSKTDTLKAQRMVAQLILEQPLIELTQSQDLSSDQIPWSVLLCDADRAEIQYSPIRPSIDWVFASIGFHRQSMGQENWTPLEKCGVADLSDFSVIAPEQPWLLASSWPLRESAQTEPYLRLQLRNQTQDSSQSKIWIRPHMVQPDSARMGKYWETLGYESVRARLGNFQHLRLSPQNWGLRGRHVNSLNSVQPAFDEVQSQYQNHLQSFWQTSTNWQQNVSAFVSDVNQGQLYDSLTMGLVSQKATDMEDGRDLTVPILAVRAVPTPRVQMAMGGFGSNWVGPEATALARIRFVQQFEYDFRILATYGTWMQAAIPEVKLSRIHGGDLAFSGNAEIVNLDGAILYRQLNDIVTDRYSWILTEKRRNINLRVHWSPEKEWELRSTVSIGKSTYQTGLTRDLQAMALRTDNDAVVNSLDAHAEWETTHSEPTPFFLLQGSDIWTLAGFRAVSLQALGHSSAPLYSRLQVRLNKAWSPLENLHFGALLSYGQDGRFNSNMKWTYPDSLALVTEAPADPALGNQYKMVISPTPFSANLTLPQFVSHHFTSASTSVAFHHQGNGFWVFGAWIHDFVGGDAANDLQRDRLTLEPIFRLHWKSLELLTGGHQTVNVSALDNLTHGSHWKAVLQVGYLGF